MMLRVVVTGGRDYDDRNAVHREIRRLVDKAGDRQNLLMINGGARGLDTIVRELCDEMGIPCITMFAPWNSRHGNRAGPVRNQWMIDFCAPTYAIVFPGGRGTADMKRRIIEAGINFHEVAS
jgi:predicted Rossmann-fold nucleotide-binding protein